MRALAILILLASPAAFAAPVPKELKKNDIDRIAGSWSLTGSCNGGGNISPPDGSTWVFTADGKAAIHRGTGAASDGVKFSVDQTTEPRKFDWICPWGEWYGVYELKDDTFTIYISSKKAGPDNGRNIQLKTGPGIEMYSFKRAAPAK